MYDVYSRTSPFSPLRHNFFGREKVKFLHHSFDVMDSKMKEDILHSSLLFSFITEPFISYFSKPQKTNLFRLFYFSHN